MGHERVYLDSGNMWCCNPFRGGFYCGECRNMLLAGNGEHLGKESKYVGMVVVLQQSKKMYNAAV